MRLALSLLIVMAGLFLSGCSQKGADAPAATNTSSSGNPLTAPTDYLGAAAKAKKAADKTVTSAGLNQAIGLFQAQEGRNPKTLDELVSKRYIGSIPPPPTGMKYDYNPQTGALKVVAQ